jgi:hypothetical protein
MSILINFNLSIENVQFVFFDTCQLHAFLSISSTSSLSTLKLQRCRVWLWMCTTLVAGDTDSVGRWNNNISIISYCHLLKMLIYMSFLKLAFIFSYTVMYCIRESIVIVKKSSLLRCIYMFWANLNMKNCVLKSVCINVCNDVRLASTSVVWQTLFIFGN